MTDASFHATLKLITGEEVLAEVCLSSEGDQEFFLINDAIVINETMQVDQQKGIAMAGLVPKKWMNYSSDSMTIIYKQHVISVSELDRFGLEFYKKALMSARMSSPIKKKVSSEENVGYVGSIDESREYLEAMYDMSNDVPE